MNAHVAGRVWATIGRGSDFYGAHARQSKAGDYVFARALAGKPAQALGNPDAPRTNTFIDDFAAGLVTLAEPDEIGVTRLTGPTGQRARSKETLIEREARPSTLVRVKGP